MKSRPRRYIKRKGTRGWSGHWDTPEIVLHFECEQNCHEAEICIGGKQVGTISLVLPERAPFEVPRSYEPKRTGNGCCGAPQKRNSKGELE